VLVPRRAVALMFRYSFVDQLRKVSLS